MGVGDEVGEEVSLGEGVAVEVAVGETVPDTDGVGDAVGVGLGEGAHVSTPVAERGLNKSTRGSMNCPLLNESSLRRPGTAISQM